VLGGLVYIALRFRRRSSDEPPPVQMHGNTRLELAWTIAPAILLLIIAVPTVSAIVDLGRNPSADALKIRVTGIQWRWQFEYLDPEYQDAEGKPLRVFDQFHIPVDREVGVQLESLDVIHSFWLPKLAGKLDVIPGRTNRMWFNATKTGTYAGQCAEFCGLSHADMRMSVVAESEEDFDAWVADQLEGGATADPGSGPALVASGE
jgi:cytochrome c oxidase subunit 2